MDVFRTVVSLEYQAQAAYDARLYQEASVLRSRAVLVAQHLDPRLVAVLCLRLGEALSADKAMLDATVVYEAGFQACSAVTPPDVERLLPSLQSVGPYFYTLDRMELLCRDDAATAEALQCAMADPLLPARLLIECAEEYERQSSLHLALYSYKRALEYLRMPTTTELRVDILTCLGSLAHRQGELATVDMTLSELMELRFSTSNSLVLCHILTGLGTLYQVVGSVENALNMYREALKMSLSINDSVAVGNARGRLTRLALQQNAKRDQRSVQERKTQAVDEYAHLPLPYILETPAAHLPRKRVVAEPVYADQAQ